jgi:hypothetical protein
LKLGYSDADALKRGAHESFGTAATFIAASLMML